MAIKRQQNWLGQQRVDVSDMRSLESGVAADFDLLAGKLIAGRVPLIARGFSISTTNTAGNPADQLQLSVAGGLILHFGASESGTLFAADDNVAAEVLSPTNPKVVGSFTAGATNHVGLDLRRTEDASTADLKQFLDADTEEEVPMTVPTARVLSYRIVISTQPFTTASNICPIAKVVTNAVNAVVSVTDARQMMFRLGRGGDTPAPAAAFTWANRKENSVVFSPSNGLVADPFFGGDKEIGSLKSWMDAVMSRLWEIGSGEHWYSATSRDGVKLIYGQPVLSNNDNFRWTLGTNTLEWSGLSVVFENSTVFFNNIEAGSAVLPADGSCLYVDIVRGSSADALLPAVGNLLTLGAPSTPGTRFIIAYRRGNFIHARDKAFELGRTIPVASTTVSGSVKLTSVAGTPTDPLVVPISASGTFAYTAAVAGDTGFAATFTNTTGSALKLTAGVGNFALEASGDIWLTAGAVEFGDAGGSSSLEVHGPISAEVLSVGGAGVFGGGINATTGAFSSMVTAVGSGAAPGITGNGSAAGSIGVRGYATGSHVGVYGEGGTGGTGAAGQGGQRAAGNTSAGGIGVTGNGASYNPAVRAPVGTPTRLGGAGGEFRGGAGESASATWSDNQTGGNGGSGLVVYGGNGGASGYVIGEGGYGIEVWPGTGVGGTADAIRAHGRVSADSVSADTFHHTTTVSRVQYLTAADFSGLEGGHAGIFASGAYANSPFVRNNASSTMGVMVPIRVPAGASVTSIEVLCASGNPAPSGGAQALFYRISRTERNGAGQTISAIANGNNATAFPTTVDTQNWVSVFSSSLSVLDGQSASLYLTVSPQTTAATCNILAVRISYAHAVLAPA